MTKTKKNEVESNNAAEQPENPVATANPEPPVPVVPPTMDAWEWTDYVLGHLRSEELIENAPTQAGLLRIFEKVMNASLYEIHTDVVQPPNPQNGNRAVVSCKILYGIKTDMGLVSRNISDVADCYPGNTAAPYCNHPSATAASMALSRALRKALRLRQGIHTTEEVGIKPTSAAADIARQLDIASAPAADKSQITVINRVCKTLGIEPNKLVGPDSEYPEYTSLDQISFNTASTILQILHNYRQGEEIPERLKVAE